MASKTTNYNLDMPGYNEVADIDVINGNMDKIDVQMKKNADSAQQSKDIVSDKYSATNTYAVGDYCIHENILYKCKTAITTGEAFDSNKWIQTTCGTEFRGLNSNLEWKLLADNVAVGTSTNVVSGAREYYVVAKYGTINIITLIPSIVLGKTIFDGHYSSASDNSRIQINTTTSALGLASFIYGGSVKDDATYSVYYR